jgi:hypothetical protein
MRKKFSAGDIFEFGLPSGKNGFFQYISEDSTQLHSQVIKVFEQEIEPTEIPNLEGIASGMVAFYAHVFLPLGVKQKIWKKVGSATFSISDKIVFRNSEDYGKGIVPVSKRWYVWHINGPFKDVGELLGECQSAEIGVVVPPDSVVYRKQYGKYDFVYPGF